jgi:redox-sensitive bicupin YhaK (pirin superfamily)
MIEIRPFDTLGHADHGWLDARHHFSFASYRDPARMGWGNIRVWNDDTIAPHTGFDPHPHNDMEIVTFIRTGAITHRDSLGNEGRTAAGDVQVMSAGTGIVHSEHNREAEPTTLFQLWILPDSKGDAPGWGQREFPREDRTGRWVILASGDPAGDDAQANRPLPIRADARVLAARLEPGQTLDYAADPSRHLYLVAPSGRILVNGVEAQPRDGVAITGETALSLVAPEGAELILVDAR